MKHLALLILVPLALGGCSPADSKRGPVQDPIAVKLAPVQVERMALPVTATGVLGPKEDIALSFKLGGVVSRVLVHEGETVREGQLLAALDLGEIDAVVARARAAAEKADRDCQRAERLFADSVVTLAQLQDSRSSRDAARADLAAATFNRTHAQIIAPAAGVILRRRLEPGEVVSSGTEVLALGSRARGQVLRAGLSDRDVVRLGLGDRAVVKFDAYPDREFAGSVSQISASADPGTGTYGVEISLPTAAGLGSGLVGTVEIRPASYTPVSLVPVESVLEANGQEATVFTLSSNGRQARRLPVRIAFLAGVRVAIRSGLEGIRSVVTEGAARLDNGSAVEVAR